LKPSEKLLLLALARFADENGVCWPSQALLSEKTGMAERTLRDATKSLSDAQLLTVEKHGRNRNRYEILIRQNPPVSVRQNLPVLNTQMRQNPPVCAAESAGLVRQNLPVYIKNIPVEHTNEQYYCPANAEPGDEKPATNSASFKAEKPESRKQVKKQKEKPVFPPEVLVLGERLAVCRTKDAGLKRTTPSAIDYYANIVWTILKRDEVELSDLEQVVAWFETPEGMESFKYGMGNMAKDYTHALIRNLPMYLRRARGESTTPRGTQTQPSTRWQRDEPQGFDYDIL